MTLKAGDKRATSEWSALVKFNIYRRGTVFGLLPFLKIVCSVNVTNDLMQKMQ